MSASQTAARPYQETGAAFLTQRNNALLGDDAGLGKTRTAIMAMDRLGLQRRLVICPAVARLVWPEEIKRWSTSQDPVFVVTPGKRLGLSRLPDRLTLVVAFDTISQSKDTEIMGRLRSIAWDVLIIDEGHRLAHSGSNRTTRIYGNRLDRKGALTEDIPRVWVLTGTPTPNHAGELYPHARALFPETISNGAGRPMEEHEFVERFCRYRDTTWGRAITGSKNQSDLRQRLGPWVMRRRKQDVLQELPSLNFVSVPVPAAKLIPPPGLASVPSHLDGDELLAYLAAHTTGLSSLRRHIGMVKLDASIEWITDTLEGGVRKLVVFAHHKELINHIMGALAEYNPVVITGDTSERQRHDAIIRFQNTLETRVFVGQIDACGVAITLTAAHDVVFVECSWVPGANYQAASRCHRLGQHDGVLARMLYVPGTLDERIIRTFQRKANETAELWD
jgi:SWI/SNF-related matrix-associated actin-dependent regulator of chromatin subfamily A-like protein 1